MRFFRTPSAGRSALLSAGLLLFLLGSNYCLVAALAGDASAMACMAPAATVIDRADEAAQSLPACHGGPVGEEAPQPAGTLPCCVAVAPVLAPQAAVLSGVVFDLPVVLVAEVGLSAPQAKPSALLTSLRESPPPLLFRAPPSSRAPPLA